MILFSHRGNVNGRNPDRENTPSYIDEAIKLGYHVEIDLRRVGEEFFLGHDYPQHLVSAAWLTEREKSLLIHLKDHLSVQARSLKWHTFCHTGDAYTLTSYGYIWQHDLSLTPDKNTIVPLMTPELIKSYRYGNVLGICSDFVGLHAA